LLIIASPGFVTAQLLCPPAGKNVSQKVEREEMRKEIGRVVPRSSCRSRSNLPEYATVQSRPCTAKQVITAK
jgi:hypothetical protein